MDRTLPLSHPQARIAGPLTPTFPLHPRSWSSSRKPSFGTWHIPSFHTPLRIQPLSLLYTLVLGLVSLLLSTLHFHKTPLFCTAFNPSSFSGAQIEGKSPSFALNQSELLMLRSEPSFLLGTRSPLCLLPGNRYPFFLYYSPKSQARAPKGCEGPMASGAPRWTFVLHPMLLK